MINAQIFNQTTIEPEDYNRQLVRHESGSGHGIGDQGGCWLPCHYIPSLRAGKQLLSSPFRLRAAGKFIEAHPRVDISAKEDREIVIIFGNRWSSVDNRPGQTAASARLASLAQSWRAVLDVEPARKDASRDSKVAEHYWEPIFCFP